MTLPFIDDGKGNLIPCHHQAPVRLRPGITVGGQEMPSGIGMTTTGKTIKLDHRSLESKVN